MEEKMLYSSPQREAVLLYLTSLQEGTEAQFTTSALFSVVSMSYQYNLVLLAQGGSMDFLAKINGRMLLCLYGIKRANVVDENQLLLLVKKHNKKMSKHVSFTKTGII